MVVPEESKNNMLNALKTSKPPKRPKLTKLSKGEKTLSLAKLKKSIIAKLMKASSLNEIKKIFDKKTILKKKLKLGAF